MLIPAVVAGATGLGSLALIKYILWPILKDIPWINTLFEHGETLLVVAAIVAVLFML
jgi:hypothetical protein